VAPSLEVLIAFRVQQALAGALIVPNGVALLPEAVPSGRLGARLGLVGAALGPPLGGLVLALDGWQGVFLVNRCCWSCRWWWAAPGFRRGGGHRAARASISAERRCSVRRWSRWGGC
jgi:MFS family permease